VTKREASSPLGRSDEAEGNIPQGAGRTFKRGKLVNSFRLSIKKKVAKEVRCIQEQGGELKRDTRGGKEEDDVPGGFSSGDVTPL